MSTAPLLVTSVPKSGTHLMTRVIERLSGTEPCHIAKSTLATFGYSTFSSGCYWGHHRYSPSHVPPPWLRIVVLIRDPRDMLVSMRDFIVSGGHKDHDSIRERFIAMPIDDQFGAIISPPKEFRGVLTDFNKQCRGFMEWRDAGATVFRYEEFFSDDAADRLLSTLAIPGVSPSQVRYALLSSVGERTRTLNVGKAGRWKEVLPESTTSRLDDLVQYLGYN